MKGKYLHGNRAAEWRYLMVPFLPSARSGAQARRSATYRVAALTFRY